MRDTAKDPRVIQAKIDTLKQVVHIVKKSKTRKEALEKPSQLLEYLKAEYNALLFEEVR